MWNVKSDPKKNQNCPFFFWQKLAEKISEKQFNIVPLNFLLFHRLVQKH